MLREVLMAISAKQTLLLFALLPMFPSSMATESNAAELVRSDVHFPCIVGDPARVDPFSALIRLSGGRDPSSRFNKDGQWQLKNAVGPFGDIDIWIDKRERPLQPIHGAFTDGGVVTQAISRAMHREVSFGVAVNRIKNLQIALLREGGIQGFDEETSTSNAYAVSNEKAPWGGWHVTMSVRQVNADKYEYLLVLRKKVKRNAAKVKDVVVEVDI